MPWGGFDSRPLSLRSESVFQPRVLWGQGMWERVKRFQGEHQNVIPNIVAIGWVLIVIFALMKL